jgi:hypothetical protein
MTMQSNGYAIALQFYRWRWYNVIENVMLVHTKKDRQRLDNDPASSLVFGYA